MRVLGGTELLLCRLVGEEVDGVLGGHQLLPRGGVHQLSMYTLAECANSYRHGKAEPQSHFFCRQCGSDAEFSFAENGGHSESHGMRQVGRTRHMTVARDGVARAQVGVVW
jgi:hypothetical protein